MSYGMLFYNVDDQQTFFGVNDEVKLEVNKAKNNYMIV